MTTTADPPRHQLPPEDKNGAAGASSSADGADESYNLAARVHGDGHINGNGRSDGDGRAAYNLASRVYGDGHASGGGDANGDAAYNLASRVYGNGAVAAPIASAVATPPRAAAPVAAPAPAGEPPQRGRKFSLRTFDSFKVVGFRWFFLAMLGQMASMNMQMLVRGFLVFELTGSFAKLGIISLASAIPGLMLTLFGGVIADRLSKKYVLQAGQLLNAMATVAVGMLLLSGVLRFEHLLVSAFVQGIVSALIQPSRQAMIPEVVSRNYLMNAVALSTAGMNFTRLAVPALGGVMLAATDAYYVYFLMTGLYLFAVLAMAKVPTRGRAGEDANATPAPAAEPMGGGRGGGKSRGAGGFRDVVDGLAYIRGNRTILVLLTVQFFIVLTSMPYMMMMPGFVKEVLGGGPDKLGLLLSITGIGSLAGSLVVASMPARSRGKILLFGSALLGFALIAFSLSNVFWLSAVFMLFVGLGHATRMSLISVLLQAHVEDAFRGRVMSIYMMEFSLMQLGVFAIGILASMIGPQYALAFSSVLLLLVVAYAYLFVPRLRDLD